MSLSIKLQAFEGPLDLLLHLIEKNKVNIYDIPIVVITQQYMDYINAMNEKDMNVMSEFLLMAATLLDIKCKMLLPQQKNEAGEEEDPRAALVEQLLQYKMYKYMSYELKNRQVNGAQSMYRKETVPQEVRQYIPPVDLGELTSDVDAQKLQNIFLEILKRQENKIDPVRSKFGKIEKEEVTLEAKLVDVKAFAKAKSKFSFRELLEKQKSKTQIVVTFLAILEMMKIGEITIQQEKLFDDILITSTIKS